MFIWCQHPRRGPAPLQHPLQKLIIISEDCFYKPLSINECILFVRGVGFLFVGSHTTLCTWRRALCSRSIVYTHFVVETYVSCFPCINISNRWLVLGRTAWACGSVIAVASLYITSDFVILCCVDRGIALCRLSLQESCEVSELTGCAQTRGREDERFHLIVCVYELSWLVFWKKYKKLHLGRDCFSVRCMELFCFFESTFHELLTSRTERLVVGMDVVWIKFVRYFSVISCPILHRFIGKMLDCLPR